MTIRARNGRNWETSLIGLVIVLSIWGAYGSVVLNEYGWTDDFSGLYVASFWTHPTIDRFYSQQGRPFSGLVMGTLFALFDTLDQLRWVRLTALVFIGVFAALLFSQVRRVMPIWLGLGAVSLVIFSPAFAVYASWAGSIMALPGAILGMAGGILLTKATEYRGQAVLRLLAACSLLLVALATYQPTACFFLAPPLIQLIGGKMPSQTRWRMLGAFLVTCAIYFITFRIFVMTFGDPQAPEAQRGHLVSDVPERLVFFVNEPLHHVFASWGIFFDPMARWTAMLVSVLLVGTLIIGSMKNGVRSERWSQPLQWLALGALVSSPLLVIKEPYAPFRALSVLYCLLALSMTGGVAVLWKWIPGTARVTRLFILTAWGALLLVNYVTTIYVTNEGLVQPNVRELNLYRRYLDSHFFAYPREVVFIMANLDAGRCLSRFSPLHEFGQFSSWVDWSPQGLLCSLFNEKHNLTPQNSPHAARWGLNVHRVRTAAEAHAFPGVAVIDAAQVLSGYTSENPAPTAPSGQ